jgi:hypothetical protein
MKRALRWPLVIAAMLALALGLIYVSRGLARVEGAPAVHDEILAYRIEKDRSLSIRIPAGIHAAVMTTWAVVPPAEGCDPAARFAYAFHATLLDDQGREVSESTFEVESRISCDPLQAGAKAEVAAKLVGSAERVTDPRTASLVVPEVLPNGGTLRLRAAEGAAVSDLLVRVQGEERRTEAARDVHGRSLDADERRRMVAGVSALGFADLPEQSRLEALSMWGRRLNAEGVEGTDYRVRRLLVGSYRSPPVLPSPRTSFDLGVSDRQAIAVTLAGPARIAVEAPPNRTLRVTEGHSAPLAVGTGELGGAVLALDRAEPRTVVIQGYGPEEIPVRLLIPREGATAVISDRPALPVAGDPARLEVRPDARVVKYLKLDPASPVAARIAPGQPLVAVVLRADLDPADPRDLIEVAVSARWGDRPEDRTSLRALLRRSMFERFRQADGALRAATDPVRALLRVPEGVSRVELTGDAIARVHLETLEPGVTEEALVPAYRVRLAEGEVWRHAPRDVGRWAPLRPEDQGSLEALGRTADLLEQVRIELAGQGAGAPIPKPERILEPSGTPVRRRLLVPATLARGEALPPGALTKIAGEARLVVEAQGSRAGRINTIFQADPAALGGSAGLFIDGVEVAREPIVTATGRLEADVAPGAHRVEVQGLGAAGVAFADAAPEGGGAIVRRREVFELAPGKPLNLEFPQGAGQMLHIALIVATEGTGVAWQARYVIDGGKQEPAIGRFFRRTTEPAGDLAGRSGDLGAGLLWEGSSDTSGGDGLSKAKIHLGDDRKPGVRRVRVELGSREPVWVSAVLIGEAATPPGEARMWVEDAP